MTIALSSRDEFDVLKSRKNAFRASAILLTRMREHHDSNMRLVRVEAPAVVEAPVVAIDPPADIVARWVRRQMETAPVLPPTPVEIIQDACGKYFNTSRAALKGSDRHAVTVYPRQIAMYLTRTTTKHSWHEIARRFRREHATVMHACRKIEGLIKKDWEVAYDVAHVEAML